MITNKEHLFHKKHPQLEAALRAAAEKIKKSAMRVSKMLRTKGGETK